jgi:hypothetical protein
VDGKNVDTPALLGEGQQTKDAICGNGWSGHERRNQLSKGIECRSYGVTKDRPGINGWKRLSSTREVKQCPIGAVETKGHLKPLFSLNKMWFASGDREFSRCVSSRRDQDTIQIIILTPRMNGIAHKADQRQQEGKEDTITER